MNKPRLTEEERHRIGNGLRERRTPYAIAKAPGRPVRTVVREIRGRRFAIARVARWDAATWQDLRSPPGFFLALNHESGQAPVRFFR